MFNTIGFKIRATFIRFLLREKVYIQYVNNCRKDIFDKSVNSAHRWYMGIAFSWQITCQGHEFWKKMLSNYTAITSKVEYSRRANKSKYLL